MKKVILSILILICSFYKAQIGSSKDWEKIAIILCTRIEGTMIDDKAFFSVGTKIPFDDTNYISLRGHFNWWDTPERKFTVIPELDYIRKVASFDDDGVINSLYAAGGISLNYISPKAGLTIYHFLTFEFGYNFEYHQNKYYDTRGFRGSFGINLIF